MACYSDVHPPNDSENYNQHHWVRAVFTLDSPPVQHSATYWDNQSETPGETSCRKILPYHQGSHVWSSFRKAKALTHSSTRWPFAWHFSSNHLPSVTHRFSCDSDYRQWVSLQPNPSLTSKGASKTPCLFQYMISTVLSSACYYLGLLTNEARRFHKFQEPGSSLHT